MSKLLIVVDKDEGVLGPSETFIKKHINSLHGVENALIGNRLNRRLYFTGKYIQSQNILGKGWRWLVRKLFNQTVAQQDTRSLAAFIKNSGVTKVLAEYGPTGTSVLDACIQADVPLIVHFHGWDAYSYYMLETYQAEYEKVFKESKLIIAVSTHMKKQLVSLGCSEKKISVNPCGADVNREIHRTLSDQVERFIMVGRLTAKKAPLLTIRAFSKVLAIHSSIKLDVIGDGPLRDEVKALIKELKLETAVNLYGACAHEAVVEKLKDADCFLQHSVRADDGDHEGTPVGVLEAMIMGLPVVATRHGGITDVIEDRHTGFLVDEHDEQQMVEAMLYVLEHPQDSADVGRRARETALANNTAEKSISDLEQLVSKV